jgi:hypothetical protein
MDRNIDLHLQCIIDHTTGAGGVANSQREEAFNYASEEPLLTDWSFAPASRLPLQEVSSSFNGLGKSSFHHFWQLTDKLHLPRSSSLLHVTAAITLHNYRLQPNLPCTAKYLQSD